MITLRTAQEIEKIRAAGRILRGAVNAATAMLAPGVTTSAVNRVIADYIASHDATASFYQYNGFPGHCCISIDEEVVHGIPGDRTLDAGSIVSIDVGVYKGGYHSDSAITLAVGDVSAEKQQLMDVTRESLTAAIAEAKPGNRLYDISAAVETVCNPHGYGIVRDLVGHGIGSELHEEPQIPNYVPNPPDRGPRLRAGMVLAIEPMVNQGTWKVRTLQDEWTVVTTDGLPSAHFEHTVAITDAGPEILTLE